MIMLVATLYYSLLSNIKIPASVVIVKSCDSWKDRTVVVAKAEVERAHKMLSLMGKLIDDFNSLGGITDFVRISDASSPGSSGKKKSSNFQSRFLTNEDDGLIINLDENEVAYRAEGNANIVLSLPKMRKVLRIRKSLIVMSNQTGTYYTQKSLIHFDRCAVLV